MVRVRILHPPYRAVPALIPVEKPMRRLAAAASSRFRLAGKSNTMIRHRDRRPAQSGRLQGSMAMSSASWRDFLKIAVAGAAGATFAPARGRAADKTVTFLHETSFIPPFDDYFQKTLAPAYEKE